MIDYTIHGGYQPHPILELDNAELLKITLEKIQAANPELKIGEPAHGGAHVLEGKKVPRYLDADLGVQLDYAVPHVLRPYVEAYSTQAIKIYFQDLHGFDIFKGFKGYVHPTQIAIPHASWLKQYKPGDAVNLRDTEFDTSLYTLTQEDFDKHSYVVFHFALSDK